MGMAVIHWGMRYPQQQKIPEYCLTHCQEALSMKQQ